MNDFTKSCDILKVDTDLGLVFGFAAVCKVDGEEYFDSQGDHIDEDALLEAAVDFVKSDSVSTDMHARETDGVTPTRDGQVVFVFPLTTDIAKALKITAPQTGLLIAMQPSPAVLAKFKSGEYTGFSIGGRREIDLEVDE